MSGATDQPATLAVTIVAHDIGPVGGMERQLSELVSGLLSRGVGVTVISRTCELGPHPHLRWVRVPGPARPFVLAYPWFFLVGSILVRRNRSGVLHTTGAIVANRADVCTVHFCHRGGGRLLLRARRQRWTYRLNAALAAPMSRLGELLLYRSRRVQVLVAVSNGLAAELIATLPGATVTVIPNGVDIGRFHPDDSARAVTRAALGVGPQESIALFVGNEWEGKGLVLAMDAVARAPGWRLVVVGDGDRARYERRAVSLGIEDRVTFLGERLDVEQWYRAADAFVSPSRYETFSLAAHEAAATGVPIVAAGVHGIDDLVVDGENGWVVPLDPDAISTRLSELARDPELRSRMSTAARASVANLGWANAVQAYVSLYEAAA